MISPSLVSMVKHYAARIFLWIFLLVLIVGGLSFDMSDKRPWIIKLYQQKSTELDYRHALDTTQRQYDNLKAQGFNWPRNESIEKEVVRRMVNQMLMKHVSDQLQLQVPTILLDDQLQSQLFAHLPEYFFDEKGQVRVPMVEKLIAPKSFAQLLDDIEQEIKTNLVYNLISVGSYVTQYEVALQCNQEYTNKKYSIIQFSLDKALDKVKKDHVSDETLERFYKKSEHGDLYKSAEQRAGRYWKFNYKDYGLTVSKGDIAAYYEKNKQSEYLETPAQVKVHRLFFEKSDAYDAKAQANIVHDQIIQDPSSFAAVAKKIAAEKLSYQGAEKTEFFAKDSTKYDKILVDTAFEQLSEDLAVSPVIKTDKGYEILQRIARKSAKYKSQSSVEQQIEDKLAQEKFAQRFKQDAERVISNVAYNKQSFDAFIEKRKGHQEQIPLTDRKMSLHAMQLFQTEAGHFSVFMEGTFGIILECTDIEKKALKPFASIKQEVRKDYYKKLAQEALQEQVTDAMKALIDADFASYAYEHGASYETAQATYAADQMDQSAILRRPEVAQKIKLLQAAGSMIDSIGSTEGLIVRLDAIEPVDEALFAEKKLSIQKTLAMKAQYKSKESFIASLYRHAKLNKNVEIKEQLLKDIKDTQL